MTRSPRTILATLLVAAFFAWSAVAFAQTPPAAAPAAPSETQEQLAARVDALAGKLAEVEKALDKVDVSEATLDKIAVDMAPLAVEAQTLVDRLTPRASSRSRHASICSGPSPPTRRPPRPTTSPRSASPCRRTTMPRTGC